MVVVAPDAAPFAKPSVPEVVPLTPRTGAALNVGSAAVPFPCSTVPAALAVSAVTAEVPSPRSTPCAVKLVSPVPPYGTPIVVAFQVPVVTVPKVVMLAEPVADGIAVHVIGLAPPPAEVSA